jgi:hypothetical protein
MALDFEDAASRQCGMFRLDPCLGPVRADLLTKFQAEVNLLRTEQMSDREILQAARQTMPPQNQLKP